MSLSLSSSLSGLVNDLLLKFEKYKPEPDNPTYTPYKTIVRQFLADLGLKRERAGMPGHLLNGPQCHVILKDPNLALLAERIGGAIGSDAASYLKAVKTLNRLN